MSYLLFLLFRVAIVKFPNALIFKAILKQFVALMVVAYNLILAFAIQISLVLLVNMLFSINHKQHVQVV